MSNNYFNDFGPAQSTFGKGTDDMPEVSELIRSKESGDKIFLVRNGLKHWITSLEVLEELGFKLGQEKAIDRLVMSKIRSGEPIKMDNVAGFKTPSDETSENVKLVEEVEEGVILPPHEPTIDPSMLSEELVASAPKEEPEKGFTSIIIPVHYNSYSLFHVTGNCIGSIREHTKLPYEIILVINGKTDIYKQAFARHDQTKADKVVELEENKGYAYAVNYGIRVAKGEYIAIINNDVLVFDNWLEDMQETLTQVDLVMASPMYGEPYSRAVEANLKREKQLDKPLEETFGGVDDFSCVLTRKNLFKEIGTFDEQFFMYMEDVDFKRRMKEADKKYAVSRKINITHFIGTTDIERKAEIMNESKEKFKIKWEKDLV